MKKIIFIVALFSLILFASLGTVPASFGKFKKDISRNFVETKESWNIAKKLPPDHSEIYVKKKLFPEWDAKRTRKNNKGKTDSVSKTKCKETFFGRICDIPKGKFWT